MLEQAVILVGGLGTRLGPLTATTPKPLLTVGNKPFLDHLAQEVTRFGIKRITLLAGNMSEQVYQRYHGMHLNGATVDVVEEDRPLGTAGALRFAADSGVLEPEFLLFNGDSWIDTDLTVLALHWTLLRVQRPQVSVLLLLKETTNTARYGAVSMKDGFVTSFAEKKADRPSMVGEINAGVYVIDRDIINLVKSGEQLSLERDVLPELVRLRKVAGLSAKPNSYFIDIGIPETLQQSREELVTKRTRPALFLDRDGTLNADSGYTHKIEDLAWLPGSREAIKLANDAGCFVFVVTNQSGVARGYYSENAVKEFHHAMQADLFQMGAHIDAFKWCPHHGDASVEAYRSSCLCRKPAPGMITDLLREWPVDMPNSLLVGDSESDLEAARAAGISCQKYHAGSLAEQIMSYLNSRVQKCG